MYTIIKLSFKNVNEKLRMRFIIYSVVSVTDRAKIAFYNGKISLLFSAHDALLCSI